MRVCCSIRFQTAKPSDAASRPRRSESKFLSCRQWKSVRHSGAAPRGASPMCKIAHRGMTPEFERRAAPENYGLGRATKYAISTNAIVGNTEFIIGRAARDPSAPPIHHASTVRLSREPGFVTPPNCSTSVRTIAFLCDGGHLLKSAANCRLFHGRNCPRGMQRPRHYNNSRRQKSPESRVNQIVKKRYVILEL